MEIRKTIESIYEFIYNNLNDELLQDCENVYTFFDAVAEYTSTNERTEGKVAFDRLIESGYEFDDADRELYPDLITSYEKVFGTKCFDAYVLYNEIREMFGDFEDEFEISKVRASKDTMNMCARF